MRRSGIKVILVTGRALFDLKALVDVGVFDSVVVENGAIVIVGDERRSLAPTEWNAQRESLLEATKYGSRPGMRRSSFP